MQFAQDLVALGYDERTHALFADHRAAGLVPGRVTRSDRGVAFVLTTDGTVAARPSTRFVKSADEGGMPVAGDWVALRLEAGTVSVEAVLPRSTAVTRRDPGRATRMQVLAANVDSILVCHPIDDGVNQPRIERELSLVWESGASPVLVLTKADLCEDIVPVLAEAGAVAVGVPVVVTSATSGEGVEELRKHVRPGSTIVFIGASGSGKSTLINTLAGEDIQETREVRLSDGRGRHTTVSRELIPLPDGALVIDTPGLRAVGMWDSEDGLAQAFSDISALAEGCRFRDCSHSGEPGCAVEAAVEAGELPARRLESYRELLAEVRHVAEQLDVHARLERKREGKALAKTIRRYHREHGQK